MKRSRAEESCFLAFLRFSVFCSVDKKGWRLYNEDMKAEPYCVRAFHHLQLELNRRDFMHKV